jgi:hypothetical protein
MLLVIGLEVTSGVPSVDPSATAERAPPPVDAAAPSFTMLPPSEFSEVLARPLFSPARRPGARAGGLAASASFTLVAIVIAPQDRRALLGFGQPAKIVRVREGQDIGGWTVEAILPDKVIVRHADVHEEVKAKDDTRSAGTVKRAPVASVVLDGAQTPPPPHHAHDE